MLLLVTDGVSAEAILTTDADGGKVADQRQKRPSEAAAQRVSLGSCPSLAALSRRIAF